MKATTALRGSRARPSCGHQHLGECPLSAEDWRVVWFAWLGFLATCRFVSESAHGRVLAEITTASKEGS